MSTLSCLIVDDEPLSQDVLKRFIMETPFLSLSGECSDAIEALTFLQKYPADLIFLDINMPKLSGINFARSLEHPPMIIFTTAYAEYAVEGFELDAIDYLLKPIAFDRFLKAVNKAIEYQKAWKIIEKNGNEEAKKSGDHLMIKSDKKIYKIDVKNIYHIQSIGDYVKIFTRDKTIIAAGTLKQMERHLGEICIRTHKSYLVAIHAIKYVEGNQINVNNQMIPIGQKYKEAFLKKFKI